MSKKWKRLKNSLELAEGRDFERKVLPFIRAIWWDIVAPEPLRTLDKSGVDILRWNSVADSTIPLVLQCKGFKVTETELSDSQIKQCRESITNFNKSEFRADTYILLINRNLKNATFRAAIQHELTLLVASGKTREAHLWSFQDLLQQARKSIRNRISKHLSLNKLKAKDYSIDVPVCAPLENVPLELLEMIATPYQKVSETLITEIVADPAKILLENDISNFTLILGKAGYGKTTTALRTYALTSKNIFYLSAASLSNQTQSTDALLKKWIDLEGFWDSLPDEDFNVLEGLFSVEINYLLRDRESPVFLILDALDESVYFSRPQGLQDLFNHIADIKVPVALLAREEFWEVKQSHFKKFFGIAAQKSEAPKRSVALIKLQDWGKNQIKAFTERYYNTLNDPERSNIYALIRLIDENKYKDIYGDIPKRPLFLNYILESVAQEGIKSKGKARLFYEWVELKIRRDISNPTLLGGEGRISILQNYNLSEDEIVRLSFKAMKLAASKMTQFFLSDDGPGIELLPSCDIEEIKSSDESLRNSLDVLSLFLHSLLEQDTSTPEVQTIKFSHRTYQEFFLALHIRDNPDIYDMSLIPGSVRSHLKDILSEGL